MHAISWGWMRVVKRVTQWCTYAAGPLRGVVLASLGNTRERVVPTWLHAATAPVMAIIDAELGRDMESAGVEVVVTMYGNLLGRWARTVAGWFACFGRGGTVK